MKRTVERPIAPPTTIAKRWVRLLVGFTVGVAVGLAPYLGVLPIPLFRPLLALYPVTLQERLIPLSAAVMGLAAVTVQWFSMERISKRYLRLGFVGLSIGAVVTLVCLTVVRAAVVVDVPYKGATEQAAFVIGWTRLPTCPCSQTSDALCISDTLTLNPVQVESCWPPRVIRVSELVLELNYLAFISCVGALVGLIVLRERR